MPSKPLSGAPPDRRAVTVCPLCGSPTDGATRCPSCGLFLEVADPSGRALAGPTVRLFLLALAAVYLLTLVVVLIAR
jgi:hypothetical protein